MGQDSKFARLLGQARVWAIASPMGEAEKLRALHFHLSQRLQYPDQVVYLGNYLGSGPQVRQALDEILSFRRWLLARPMMFLEDHAYLRGAQEEIWSKLLQLHFAPNPREILAWVLDHGAAATLESYGGNVQDGIIAAREGPVAIARWTSHLRACMAACPGHQPFMTHLRRAAISRDGQLLFVNSGLDPDKPLEGQKDAFWWSSAAFARMSAPYGEFRRVVRGSDPAAAGLVETPHSLSFDGGAGRGGVLNAVCLAPDGTILDHLSV